MAVSSKLANSSRAKRSQLKLVKTNLQPKPIYFQQGFTDLTWWWKTIAWLFRTEPTLADRAAMLVIDAGTLIRDAVKELFTRMESFFVDIKDAAVRYANVIVTLIVSFVRQFKKSFNQTVEFFREAFRVTGDKDGLSAVNELHRANVSRRKRRASAPSRKPAYEAQGGDDDGEECDFFIFKFLTTFVTKLIAFFDMLPKLEFSLSKLNASLTLLGHCDRFDLIGKSKWLLNVIYSAITGKELFEDVTMSSDFTKYVNKLNTRLTHLEEVRNPTLDVLIQLRKDEKELTKCYTYLISAFPKRAPNYTTVYNHAIKRCAQFAGSVQGMQGRIKPVTLVMSGPAGCGKTTVQRALEHDVMSVVSSLLQGSTDDDAKIFAEHATRPASFSRNCVESTPDFDDGYCNPMFYILEEYLTLKDKTISVEWAAKLIRYADSGPLLLNFAFGAKGTKYFDSPFVIATGNFPNGHVVPFNDPTALFRRIDFDLIVRSTAGSEKFNMRKHVVFKMSDHNVTAHRDHYVNRAFERFNIIYPETSPKITDEFNYDQLVMLMVFCYLERIAPENSPQNNKGSAVEIAAVYNPKIILRKMKVARNSDATFFGREEVFSHTQAVAPDRPHSTPPTFAQVHSAEEDDDDVVPPTHRQPHLSSSESDEDSVVDLRQNKSSDITTSSSDDESVIELDDGSGVNVVADDSDDEFANFEAQTHNKAPVNRRSSKPHPLVVRFVDYLNIFEIPIACVSMQAMKIYLNSCCEQLKLIFTSDFKYTPTFLSLSTNQYSAYAKFAFQLLGYKKLFVKQKDNSSPSNVSNVMKAIRHIYAHARDILDLLKRTPQHVYEQELRPSGPILLREAYATVMTGAQRQYVRSNVKFVLAVSKPGELANISRIKKRDLWLKKRQKKNKTRQQQQTAAKQARRDALRRETNGARNSRGDTNLFETEIHRRQGFGFDWADDDEDYEGFEDHDISDLYVPMEHLDQDEIDSSVVRTAQDKRKFYAQTFYELNEAISSCVERERLGYYAAAYEYRSFFTSNPSDHQYFSSGSAEMTTNEHFVVLFANLIKRKRLLRCFNTAEFLKLGERLSKKYSVEILRDLIYDLSACVNIGQILVVIYDCLFSSSYKTLTDDVKKRGDALDFFLVEYCNDVEHKKVGDMKALMKRCSMLCVDLISMVTYFKTCYTSRFYIYRKDDLAKLIETINVDPIDDKDFFGALKLIGVGLAFSLAIAYVVKSLGRTTEVSEASDLLSNMSPTELEELEELIEDYKAQSLDNKKPMTKPAKRSNVTNKFKAKYAAHSGTSHAIRNIVMKNCYACISGPNDNVFGTLTFLGGQIAMMNRHVFDAITSFNLVPYAPKLNGANQILKFPKSEARILRTFPNTDTVVLAFASTARAHAGLWKFLMTRSEYASSFAAECCMISFDDADAIAGTFDPVSDVVFKKEKPISLQRSVVNNTTMTIDRKIAYTWSGARPGACGSVLMGSFKGTQKLIGIHAAGLPKTHHGLSVPVMFEDIQDIFTADTPEGQFCCQDGSNICFEDEDPLLGAYCITPDSITTPIHTNPCNGTVFVSTPFVEGEFLGGPPGRPADLSTQAYINNLIKEKDTVKVFQPHDDVYDIARNYSAEIASLFTMTQDSSISGCRTLTNEEAMYGYRNLEKFDWSSAEGINLKLLGVKKKDLSDPNSQAAVIVSEHIDESYRLKVDEHVYNYQINTDSLKDEIRDHVRVEAKKTRVFNVTDTVNNIEIKRAVGDLVSKTKEGFMLGPAMCGINPTSMCWTMLYNLFSGHDVVFTDVSGFDYTAVMWIMLILTPWLRIAYGHNRAAYKYSLWAVMSCLLGLRFAFGRGRMLGRGNTSGNWITTFLNTLVNTCFHGVAVVYLAKENGDDPVECLRSLKLALYSDDNISQLPYSWWHTANVVKTFKLLFNITLTDVNKGTICDDVVLYSIDQAEFLSRRFVKRDGVVYAPLGLDSLISQLYWVRIPRGSPDSFVYTQLQQNIDNVLRELCEYPVDEAYDLCAKIADFICANNIPCVVRPFEYYRTIELKMEYA